MTASYQRGRTVSTHRWSASQRHEAGDARTGAPSSGTLLEQIRAVRAYIPGATSIRRICPSPWSPSTLTFAT